MQNAEDLLFKYHITPTLLSQAQKSELQSLLSADAPALLAFFDEAQRELIEIGAKIEHLATKLRNALEAPSLVMESILGNSSEKRVSFAEPFTKRALFDKHLGLIKNIDLTRADLERITINLLSTRQTAEETILSPAFPVKTTLYHIALQEKGQTETANARKEQTETAIAVAARCAEDLLDLLNRADEALAYMISNAAHTEAQIRRDKRPQTDYFNLLRTHQLSLHQLMETAEHIQKIAHKIQSSDTI